MMKWLSQLRTWKAFTLINFVIFLHAVNISAGDFSELFQADWAPDHVVSQGDQTALSLDSSTGN